MAKRATPRRPTREKQPLVVFSVRLPASTIQALRLLAERNRRTVATQTLIVIEDGLKANDGTTSAAAARAVGRAPRRSG